MDFSVGWSLGCGTLGFCNANRDMHGWLSIVAIILAGLTALYVLKMDSLRPVEGFADFIGAGVDGYSCSEPDVQLAMFTQGLPLADMLATQTGLTSMDASRCASVDKARELELDGQYVQRTNNYRRDYPDNCSAPLSELVNAVYKPKDGMGMTVPCGGQC
jgi:hypothetical protein